MTDTNGSKVEKAAESATLRFVARWMISLGVPAILAMGGWMGTEVWGMTKRSAESTFRLEEKITALIDRQLPEMRNSLNDRINAHVQRLDSIDRRNDSQDGKLDELQRQIIRGRNP